MDNNINENLGQGSVVEDVMGRKPVYISFNYDCNMGCGYCSSKGFPGCEKKPGMSIDDAKELSKWLLKDGVSQVIAFGGEPTLHPQIGELTDIFKNDGMRMSIATNGVFDIDPELVFSKMEGVVVHILPSFIYRPEEREVAIANVKKIATMSEYISGRYVVDNNPIPIEEIIDYTKKAGMNIVLFVFARPAAYYSNDNLPYKEIKRRLPEVVSAIRKLRELGIEAAIGGNQPFCLIEGYESEFTIPGKVSPEGFCAINEKKEFDPSLVVNPDLSFNVCVGLPMKAPRKITEFSSLREAKDYFKEGFEILRKKPIMPECESCDRFMTDCQGGCLAYKLN